MTESAGEQITEYLNDRTQPSETENLDTTDEVDEQFPVRTAREGLPRNFRMRHDAHYVDELMSRTTDPSLGIEGDRRSDRPAAPPPAAASTAEPQHIRATAATPHVAAAPAFALIANRLESVVAHADIRPRHRTPSLIAHSVQAEFARVARLARAAAVLHDDEPPMRRDIAAREIADAVVMTSAPVARLSGIEFDVVVDDPAFTIAAEPELILQTLAGTIDALVDLLFSDPRRQPDFDSRQPAPRISISLRAVRVRPAMFVDVTCPAVFISSRHAVRVFDNDPDDYRAAPAAGLLLAAAARIVRAHDGRVDVRRHTGAGLTLTYVLPQMIGESRLS